MSRCFLAVAASSLGLALALPAAFAGCGTGAPPAGGDQNLPNALAGPFRVFRKGETGKVAPFVLTDVYRSPGVIDLDGDPQTPEAALYVATASGTRRISRYELPDGRTASLSRVDVLKVSEAWEDAAGGVDHPMPLRVGGEVWLYYSSAGCVGRAVSTDGGTTFEKKPDKPLLCGNDGKAPWENGWLGSPSVHQAPGGSFVMFYESDGGIGEARSADGVSFERAGAGPVLLPREAQGPAPDPDGGVDEVFDDDRVGDPMALPGESSLGRPITYLYYTGRNRLGRFAIGLAARYGDDGPFTRNATAALARYDARAPFVLKAGSVAFLYAEARSSEAAAQFTLRILGAVAPATTSVPLPPSPDAGAPK